MKEPGLKKRKTTNQNQPTAFFVVVGFFFLFFSSGNMLCFEGWIEILQLCRTSWELELWCVPGFSLVERAVTEQGL